MQDCPTLSELEKISSSINTSQDEMMIPLKQAEYVVLTTACLIRVVRAIKNAITTVYVANTHVPTSALELRSSAV
jgi:hypothetical protein